MRFRAGWAAFLPAVFWHLVQEKDSCQAVLRDAQDFPDKEFLTVNSVYMFVLM